MRFVRAFCTLIRWPNVLFIILTQVLVYFKIVKPAVLEKGLTPLLDLTFLSLLCVSTAMIAAAGYMINDYFDIGTDNVNKPEKVTIERVFKRRSIIIWHILLNALGLGLMIWMCASYFQLRLVIIQVISIALLLFYSSTLKRKLLIGNISIGFLTALTVFSVGAYEYHFHMFKWQEYHVKLAWVYMAFAFMITLIRELAKDIEDVKGDSVINCDTFPIRYGVLASKRLIYGLSLAMIVLIVITCVHFFSNKALVVYLVSAVILPTVFVIKKTNEAKNFASFNSISSYVKIITLLGILSLLLV